MNLITLNIDATKIVPFNGNYSHFNKSISVSIYEKHKKNIINVAGETEFRNCQLVVQQTSEIENNNFITHNIYYSRPLPSI